MQNPIWNFTITVKKEKEYRSSIYPLNCIKGLKKGKRACAPMPYAMKFNWAGEAIHGSDNLPGFNASHGCVRVLEEDAKWINNFVDIGTKITIKRY
jgi:lipoprotein-anchoring transpeptidase ErfK/SrfK